VTDSLLPLCHWRTTSCSHDHPLLLVSHWGGGGGRPAAYSPQAWIRPCSVFDVNYIAKFDDSLTPVINLYYLVLMITSEFQHYFVTFSCCLLDFVWVFLFFLHPWHTCQIEETWQGSCVKFWCKVLVQTCCLVQINWQVSMSDVQVSFISILSVCHWYYFV